MANAIIAALATGPKTVTFKSCEFRPWLKRWTRGKSRIEIGQIRQRAIREARDFALRTDNLLVFPMYDKVRGGWVWRRPLSESEVAYYLSHKGRQIQADVNMADLVMRTFGVSLEHLAPVIAKLRTSAYQLIAAPANDEEVK